MVLFVLKPWLILREYGNSERILDVLVVVRLLLTLKHVINVNSQKKFIMNVPESDARASFPLSLSFIFLGTGLLMSFHGNSCTFDHFHLAANTRSERLYDYWIWTVVSYIFCMRRSMVDLYFVIPLGLILR